MIHPKTLLIACSLLLALHMDARATSWADRNSPEGLRALAGEFFPLLALDAESMRANNLQRTAELNAVNKALEEGDTATAIQLYIDYFTGKLRAPHMAGYELDVIDPQRHWHSVLPSKFDPEKVVAQADRLLNEQTMVLGGNEVKIGPPGQVNWNEPYPRDEPVPYDKTPYQIVPWMSFMIHAYMLTGELKYLERWAEYMDDWALNVTYSRDVHPTIIPTRYPNPLMRMLKELMLVAKVDTPLTPVVQPATYARILNRMVREHAMPALMYIRSNCHNWTPDTVIHMQAGLILEDFKIGSFLFREGRRLGAEGLSATHHMRDGTENQQDPWYNPSFLRTGYALDYLDARTQAVPGWNERPWVNVVRDDIQWRSEIREHLANRMRYLLRIRVPNNQWPIPVRNDRREAHFIPPGHRYTSAPEVFDEQEIRHLIAAMTRPGDGLRPQAVADWFPYAGFNIVREGWERRLGNHEGHLTSGYGAMFTSPKPGAYGGYRSRSDNNQFGLNFYGEDLLLDDNMGNYSYRYAPIRADGREQFFHAGITKVPTPSGHKTYMVSAWTDPAPWRWHDSTAFNLMEGVYEGSWAHKEQFDMFPPVIGYGLEEGGQKSLGWNDTVREVKHQRWVHYVRDAKLWIVTDRMHGEKTHTYEQLWYIPFRTMASSTNLADQIVVDATARRAYTRADTRINDGRVVPAANLEMVQFSSADLEYVYDPHYRRNRPDFKEGQPEWSEINVKFGGQGSIPVVTVFMPLSPGSGDEEFVRDVRPLEGENGVTGFSLTTHNGIAVRYLCAPNEATLLEIDGVQAVAESLLIADGRALVMGASSMSIKGQAVDLPHSDFEIALAPASEDREIEPVYRPIAPVDIHPAQNVFIDELDVTLSSATPGVDIRYTLDGSDPTPESALYTEPIRLSRSTVVRTRAYRPGVTENPLHTSGTHATPISFAVYTQETALSPTHARNAQPGLRYRYFEEDEWQKLWVVPDTLTPAKEGAGTALFDLSVIPESNPPLAEGKAAPRNRYFALEYSGLIQVPETGVYTFHAPREYVYPDTDAGYELVVTVNGQTWYPATRLHAFGNWSIPLTRGHHAIKIWYIDHRTTGPSIMNLPDHKDYIWTGTVPDLRLSGPGLDKQTIPAGWLVH